MAFVGRVKEFSRSALPFVSDGSAFIGAILIGLVWLSVGFFLNNERNTSEQAAVQNAMNLAGAFEEHLSRSIGEIDRSLKTVRAAYARDPGGFDLMGSLKAIPLFNQDVLQVSILDRNGRPRPQ
jgi:hypothetical protein